MAVSSGSAGRAAQTQTGKGRLQRAQLNRGVHAFDVPYASGELPVSGEFDCGWGPVEPVAKAASRRPATAAIRSDQSSEVVQPVTAELQDGHAVTRSRRVRRPIFRRQHTPSGAELAAAVSEALFQLEQECFPPH